MAGRDVGKFRDTVSGAHLGSYRQSSYHRLETAAQASWMFQGEYLAVNHPSGEDDLTGPWGVDRGPSLCREIHTSMPGQPRTGRALEAATQGRAGLKWPGPAVAPRAELLPGGSAPRVALLPLPLSALKSVLPRVLSVIVRDYRGRSRPSPETLVLVTVLLLAVLVDGSVN